METAKSWQTRWENTGFNFNTLACGRSFFIISECRARHEDCPSMFRLGVSWNQVAFVLAYFPLTVGCAEPCSLVHRNLLEPV